jgi:hypothetical protein
MTQRAAAVVAWRATHQKQIAPPPPPPPPPTWEPVNMIGQLPTRPGGWETASYPYRSRDINRVRRFRVHYTAGPTSASVHSIASYQVGPTAQADFPAIAYHLLVEGNGRVNWCHDFDKRVWGSAAPGANEMDIHCCYTGDYEPTPIQIEGMRNALAWAERRRGFTLELLAHRTDYATNCPGPTWEQWRDQLR